ncbi:hypothetical protein ES332_A13G120800v1 [Gossypium tomentosum]|uniref:Uncharacterized protein n=1 Tax=Gossypium tomentosum TaxID=34277 RepID=A0A5D2MJ33_GOSTO|nr:hypothetical protein ES332_A13G120800v1 [Gossypium tomentosum]
MQLLNGMQRIFVQVTSAKARWVYSGVTSNYKQAGSINVCCGGTHISLRDSNLVRSGIPRYRNLRRHSHNNQKNLISKVDDFVISTYVEDIKLLREVFHTYLLIYTTRERNSLAHVLAMNV